MVAMTGQLMLKLDRLRHDLEGDRRGIETPALFQYLLLVGEVSGAVEQLEVHDRTGGDGAFL